MDGTEEFGFTSEHGSYNVNLKKEEEGEKKKRRWYHACLNICSSLDYPLCELQLSVELFLNTDCSVLTTL